MQALCQVVFAALEYITDHPHEGHIHIWARPKQFLETVLTLLPHSNTHFTHNSHALLTQILDQSPSSTVSFHRYEKTWAGTPGKKEVQALIPTMD